MTTAIILVILVILAGIAWIKNTPRLKANVLFIFMATLVLREFAIGSASRGMVQAVKQLPEAQLQGFVEGSRAVVDYCWETSIYVWVIAILTMALSIRSISGSTKSP